MIKMTNTKVIIDEALKKSRKLREVYIKINWEKIVGDLKNRCFPVYIKESTLFIVTDASSVLHYLTLNKENILKKSNDVLKGEYLKEIVVRIGNVEQTDKRFFGGNNE